MKNNHLPISLDHGDYTITYQIVTRKVVEGQPAPKDNDVQLRIIQTENDRSQSVLIDPDQVDILTCWINRLNQESQ